MNIVELLVIKREGRDVRDSFRLKSVRFYRSVEVNCPDSVPSFNVFGCAFQTRTVYTLCTAAVPVTYGCSD